MFSVNDIEVRYYLDLENQGECRVCSNKFSKEDLLQEKVHKTWCNHFFHTACLDNLYKAKPSESLLCKTCKTPTDYAFDSKDWKATIERIRHHIQNRGRGSKRHLEDSKEALVIPPPNFKPSLWRKIVMHTLSKNRERPDLFCRFLTTIQDIRLVCKDFSQWFSLEECSPSLKIYLEKNNMQAHKILSSSLDNPLILACAKRNFSLIRFLLLSSDDPTTLATQRDDFGVNAFNYLLFNKPNVKSLKLMLETAQVDIYDECMYSVDWDCGALDYLNTNKEDLACMKLLLEKADNKYNVLDYELGNRLFKGDKEMVLFFLDQLFQFSDKPEVANFCANYDFARFFTDHNIPKEKQGEWFEKFLPREFIPRWFKLMENEQFECIFTDSSKRNLLHSAISIGGTVELIQAIIQHAHVDLLKPNFFYESVLVLALNSTKRDMAEYLAETMRMLAKQQNDEETLNRIENLMPEFV